MIQFPIFTYKLDLSSLKKAHNLEEKLLGIEGVVDALASFSENKLSVILQDNIIDEKSLLKKIKLIGYKDLEILDDSEGLFSNNVVASFGYPLEYGKKGNVKRTIVDEEGEVSAFKDNTPDNTYKYKCGSTYLIRHKFEIDSSQILFAIGGNLNGKTQTFWGRRMQLVCDSCYCCAGALAVKSRLKLV